MTSKKKAASKKTASKKKAAASSGHRRRSEARADRTHRAREKFLEEFRERGIVRDACKAAGIGRRTAYDWYESDTEFARQWDQAEQEAADALEYEAYRRAVYGAEKPTVYQGHIVDSYREYSDRLLELMLRARRPERFSEKHDVKHSGGINVSLSFDTSAAEGSDP